MSDDLFSLFAAPLHAAGLHAAVSGAVAAMVYGVPRPTEAIELVVALDEAELDALHEAFDADAYVMPPRELARAETQRALGGRVVVLHRETELRADLRLVGADLLDRWALDGAREVVVRGVPLRIAPPEHVIIDGLEALRRHDDPERRADVRTILQQHGDQLDNGALATWIVQRGLQPQWTSIIEELKAG